MKINSLLLTSIAMVIFTDSVAAASSDEATAVKEGHLYHPTFWNEIEGIMTTGATMPDKRRPTSPKYKSKKSAKSSQACDPAKVELLDYPQWEAEKGYWIGEYTFLKGDGTPFVSSSWNYPYDHYKGFITGEVVGNSYRQRNVFLYPPQITSVCATNNEVQGNGTCGTNGNTKIYMADQSATTCSMNEELGGDIEGPFIQASNTLPTKTQLVGQDNAILYQVFIPGALVGASENRLLQSQLTTITESPDGQVYRTRTAQGFDTFVDVGVPTYASFYRERKVNETEFYNALESAIEQYAINPDDLCKWDSRGNAIANATGSFDTCKGHLEQSFDLE